LECRGDRVLVGGRAGGGDEIDGIADARVGREASRERLSGRGTERRHAEARSLTGVRCEDAGTTRVRDDADTSACGQRLKVETLGDVEHFVDRVGAHHARLLEECGNGRFIRREARRVAAGRAAARRRPSRLDDDDRFLPGNAARELREAPRVPEGLEVEQHDRCARIALAPLQKVVAGDVGLVAEAHERGDAHPSGGRQL
jgi:hypothetical protein